MREWLFEKLFSKYIPFRWVNGHKTDIARVAAGVSAAALALAEFMPGMLPMINTGTALMATVLSLVGIEIGKMHKSDKGE